MNRWFNVLNVWFCYLCARCIGKAPYMSVPYSISIEPTNCCNLSCLECPSGIGTLSRERGEMEFRLYKRIIDEIKDKIVSLTLYFQGEPFINSHFIDMVSHAKRAGLWVETSTNAHFIDDEVAKGIIESGLDKIIVSLDGTDAESYAKYRRGGDFDRVIRGIEALVNAKKNSTMKSGILGLGRKPKIVLQFLVFKHNEHQIKDIKALGRRLGVDKVELKTAQIYNAENASSLLTSVDRYARYTVKDGVMEMKRKRKRVCSRVFTNAVMTWEGQMVPCCYDKDAEHCVGDVREDYYVDIMKDDRRREFIDSVIKNRNAMKMCCNCNH